MFLSRLNEINGCYEKIFPVSFSFWSNLKCYYDQKITFIFSSDFETMFIKHSASEIISLNFEKKTVNLNCNFPF